MNDPAIPSNLHHVLIVKDRNGPKAYWLTAPMYTMGRETSNSIRLDSPFVSRHHAVLVKMPAPLTPTGFVYQILDGDTEGNPSTNGIAVNNRRVDYHDLQDGDEIRFSTDVTANFILRDVSLDTILSTYEHTEIVLEEETHP
ncbi:MAG: hypothetical protein OHK0012_22460 [Synechococcales cyanobacterium]